MQLTAHFSLEELIASETATRSGIDNTPPSELMPNLRALADGLEKVRAALGGRPIHINSGYRCPALNKAVDTEPSPMLSVLTVKPVLLPRTLYPPPLVRQLP